MNTSGGRNRPRWLYLCAVIGVYAALALLHTYPLIFHLDTMTPAHYNAVGTAYLLAEQALLFYVEHPFDLAAVFSPAILQPMEQPFLYCNTSLLSALVFGPIFLAGGSVYLLHNVFILVNLVGFALATFLLARHFTGSDRAGFLAGAVAAFTSFNFFFFADTLFLNAFLVPLIALAFERFAAGKRHAILVVAVLFAAELYNNSYQLVIAAVVLGSLVILRFRLIARRRNLPWIVGAVVLTCLAMAPLAVHYIDHAVSAEVHLEFTLSRFSLGPGEWFNVHPENLVYGGLSQAPPRARVDILGALFPGLASIALIALGASFRGPRRRLALVFTGLVLVSVALSTGWIPFSFEKQPVSNPVVYSWLLELVPPLRLFRVPFRWLTLGALAAAVAAAVGYQHVEAWLRRRGLGRKVPLVFGALVALVTLENLVLPRPLFEYDDIVKPSAGDRWIAKEGLPEEPGELILHLPSWPYRGQGPERGSYRLVFERWSAPLYRHLYYRHPMANERLSFLPEGWAPEAATRMPDRVSQEYLRAIGVRVVVVHSQLLGQDLGLRLGERSMVDNGLEKLRSFEDGDAVYRIPFDVVTTPCLRLVPTLAGDILSVGFELDAACGGRGPDLEGDETLMFVNPMKCAPQELAVTVRDGGGELHREVVKFQLPLVSRGEDELKPLTLDLAGSGRTGPFKLVDLEPNDEHIL